MGKHGWYCQKVKILAAWHPEKNSNVFWLHLFYEKEQKEDQRAEFSVTFISFHFLAISIRGRQQDLLKSVKLSKPRI